MRLFSLSPTAPRACLCATALLSLLALSSCGRAGEHGAGALLHMRHGALPLMTHALRLGMRGARPHGLRRACASDVSRLCPEARSRREERKCLEAKHDTLSADCRSALDERGRRQDRTAH